ncbi:hypothetical protein T484DRAFT_1772740, partial [Baffinella frigidus]
MQTAGAFLPGSSIAETDIEEYGYPDFSPAPSTASLGQNSAHVLAGSEPSNFVSMRGAVLDVGPSTAVSMRGAVLDVGPRTATLGQNSAHIRAGSEPSNFVSMRGAVLSVSHVSRVSSLPTAHPHITGDAELDVSTKPLIGNFSLRGELMHVFVSYRVATEGAAGNGMSILVAEKIRALSMDNRLELQIPRDGWGIWPQGVKKPSHFLQAQAKVFLDKDCLQDGQSWLSGFVTGVVSSMVFVPLLSWTEDDRGSVGELSRLGVDGFDRVDNVLLEMIIAMALRQEAGSAIQARPPPTTAVLPLLIGTARPSAEGGGFRTFPFYKLARLSAEPSEATNARAASILR